MAALENHTYSTHTECIISTCCDYSVYRVSPLMYVHPVCLIVLPVARILNLNRISLLPLPQHGLIVSLSSSKFVGLWDCSFTFLGSFALEDIPMCAQFIPRNSSSAHTVEGLGHLLLGLSSSRVAKLRVCKYQGDAAAIVKCSTQASSSSLMVGNSHSHQHLCLWLEVELI